MTHARTGEPDDGRQEVENQDGELAHGTIQTSQRNPRNAKNLGIRHAQVGWNICGHNAVTT